MTDSVLFIQVSGSDAWSQLGVGTLEDFFVTIYLNVQNWYLGVIGLNSELDFTLK